jgi:CHAT domain-containing protein
MVDPLAAKETAGDKLYQLLVVPAAKWIPPDASVVIVPDGALHGINFETLPVDGPRRHYWIDDVEIQVAPSLASLAASTPKAAPASNTLLLIGNAQERLPDFPALRYAPAEMSAVAGHFHGAAVQALGGDRATPDAYRTSHAERFEYVHFTAHATTSADSPLDSAVILSGPDSAYKLYARDVADQPLAADLVTVSACRSAGERAYSGEGLVGFSWAFLRAGARRVVAGLWDVDDRSTSELMDHLYANLVAGDRPAHALRRAKLAMLARGGASASPYRWAPFELFTVTP